MFQQWEKGREKTAFPTVFNYEYNRQKFANLDKADQKAIVPRVTAPLTASQDRKLRKRKSRSLERRRQPKNIELSDSDEEITVQQPPPQPTPPSSGVEIIDEVDHCATPVTEIAPAHDIIDRIEKAPDPEPISHQTPNRIEESSTSTSISGPESSHCQNVIVDVHEPDVVLEIREDTDEGGPLRGSSFRTKLAKDSDLDDVPESDAENERPDEHQSPAPTPSGDNKVQLEEPRPEPAPEPLVLVPKCDINENVVVSNDSHSDVCSIVEVDINHNDLTHSIDQNQNECKTISSENNNNDEIVLKRHEQRRISESSRSSFDESDGLDTEPTYARVDSLKHMVSYCLKK